jgi:hypothetical protein
MSGRGEGVWGNREVPPRNPPCLRGALTEKKGLAGKHGFHRASEPEASEAVA